MMYVTLFSAIVIHHTLPERLSTAQPPALITVAVAIAIAAVIAAAVRALPFASPPHGLLPYRSEVRLAVKVVFPREEAQLRFGGLPIADTKQSACQLDLVQVFVPRPL